MLRTNQLDPVDFRFTLDSHVFSGGSALWLQTAIGPTAFDGVGGPRLNLNAQALLTDDVANDGSSSATLNVDGEHVVSTLNTPRLLDVKVTDNAGQMTFLSYSDALAHGEELVAVALGDRLLLVRPVSAECVKERFVFRLIPDRAVDVRGDA